MLPPDWLDTGVLWDCLVDPSLLVLALRVISNGSNSDAIKFNLSAEKKNRSTILKIPFLEYNFRIPFLSKYAWSN